MDFDRLNRRQLQYLCKLNKIPANITNIAMAHSLKSLHTVEGLEEFLNPSKSESADSSIESPEKSEVTSPKVPRTICRTSTRQKVKKLEVVENLGKTVSRGVRKQSSGNVSDFLKTPSVTSTSKKVLAASSRQNVARQDTSKKQTTTVQRVYNTRRAARLMEKKCADADTIEREGTQPVKIDLFLDEVSATSEEDLCNLVSEKSSGSGSSSIGTSHELDVSSENIKGSVAEGSVESCDIGISKSTVEGMCISLEKLDVLDVNGNDQISTIQKILPDTLERPEEKVGCCDELDISKVKSVESFEQHKNVDLEDRQNVADNLVLNDFDTSKDWNDQVHKLKPDLEGISYSCEDEDLEESLMVANEKIDLDEAPNVGENSVLNEVDTSDSEENSGQKDNLKPDIDNISSSCENEGLEEKLMVGNIQNLKIQETLPDATLKSAEEEVGFCDELKNSKLKSVEHFDQHENVDLEDTQLTVENIVHNEVVMSEEKSSEDGDLEEKFNVAVKEVDSNVFEKPHAFVVDESDRISTIQKTLPNATLESGEEVDCCDELDSSKVKSVEHLEPHESLKLEDRQSVGENFAQIELGNPDSEEKVRHISNLKPNLENIYSYSEDGDLKEKLMVDKIQNSKIQETLQDATLGYGEEELGCCDELNNSKLKSVENFEGHENADLENTQDVVEKIVMNEVVTSEEGTIVDNLKLDLETVSYLSEDGGLEEKVIFSDKKVDSIESPNVSVSEQILTTENSRHVDSTFESGEKKVDYRRQLDSIIHVTSAEIVGHYENFGEKFPVNEVDNLDSEEDSGQIDNLKHSSESISSSCEDGDLEEKLVVINEKTNLNEASNIFVEQENAILAPKELPDSFLSEDNVINAEAILFDSQNPTDSTCLELEDMSNVVLEMKSETMELNDMAGDIIHLNSKSFSELSKLDYPDKQSVAKEMTEDGLEETIFTSTVLVEYMNSNEQELSMDFELAEKEHDIFSKSSVPINNVNPMEQELAMSFEAPSEEQNLFTGDTVEDMAPTNHEELDFNLEKHNESAADITFVEEENQFSRDTNDVINHSTHLSAMKQETLSDSPTSLKGMTKARNNDENSARKLLGAVVEDDVSKKAEQEKPKSLSEKSLRQLKKQLKALSIKSIDTDKDDMVDEARPALQAVYDNQFANGDDN